MKIRIQLVLLAAAGVAVLSSGLALGAAGQQAGTAAARPAIPRTTDGKPDLSGIWSVMNAVNSNILPHAASADVPPVEGWGAVRVAGVVVVGVVVVVGWVGVVAGVLVEGAGAR